MPRGPASSPAPVASSSSSAASTGSLAPSSRAVEEAWADASLVLKAHRLLDGSMILAGYEDDSRMVL